MTRAGITGHRKLESPESWFWVNAVLRAELAGLKPPLVGTTSLAIGADQVFASLVLEAGGTLYAVLPFAGIERTFAPADLPIYRELLRDADLETLNTPGTDEDAFLAAGKRVVDLSDVVFAVWDGKPARGRGGTADIVDYATRRGVPLIHLDPLTRTVTHS